MAEQSLMVSDLVSEDTQVDIGQLLGADVILVGNIASIESYKRINVQILEVQTGSVIGGFVLDYLPEDSFLTGTNRVMKAGAAVVEVSGAATIRTIIEDFEGAVLNVGASRSEEHWGPRILAADSTAGLSDEGWGYLAFEADIDTVDITADWSDSDLNYYALYRTDWKIAGQDGVAVRIRPETFSHLSVIIQQTGAAGEQRTFMAPLTVNPGEWTDLQIPFSSFLSIDGSGGVDPKKPVDIGFAIGFSENFKKGFFRAGTSMTGRLGVDDLGFFSFRDKDSPGLIDAWEDEVTRAPGTLQIGGIPWYVDYSQSDAGVMKYNKGITSQEIRVDRMDDGPAGGYLRLTGRLSVNGQIREFLNDNQDLYILYSITFSTDWPDFDTLTLLSRSDTVEGCFFEVAGLASDRSWGGEFAITPTWTQIRKPYSSLKSDGSTMQDSPPPAGLSRINLIFPIPRRTVERAVNAGKLEFRIDLDQILLQ
jgi:hypothetical protein